VQHERKKRRRMGADVDMESSSDDSDNDDDDDEEPPIAPDDAMEADDDLYSVPHTSSSRTQRASRRAAATSQSESQDSWASTHQADSIIPSQDTSTNAGESSAASASQGITPQRQQMFQRAMGSLLNTPVFDAELGAAEVEPLLHEINQKVGTGNEFSRTEGEAALKAMTDANLIMYTEGGLVYRV